MEAWHVWVMAAVVLLIAETLTPGFVVGCLGLSAFAAAAAARAGGSLAAQLAVFSVASFLVLWLGRPYLERRFGRPARPVRTNAAGLIGRVARVSEAITAAAPGRVVTDGDDWRAEATDGRAIPAGTRVRVVRIEGITLLVEPAADARLAREES